MHLPPKQIVAEVKQIVRPIVGIESLPLRALGCLDIGFKWSLSPFGDLRAIPSLTVHPHLLTETALLKPTNLPQTAERKRDNTLYTRSNHQGNLAASGTQGVDVDRPPPPLLCDLFPRHDCLVNEFVQVESECVVGEVGLFE